MRLVPRKMASSDGFSIVLTGPNTLMLEGCATPFKYKRKKLYKNLTGQRVNLSYYPSTESVAGIEMEVMNIVRIKIS